jgi:hypothetical protein
LSSEAFTGQAFHRLAACVTDEQLEKAQLGIARAAAERFGLSTDVLAFDTTNFDTHIATATAGNLARRGHAKSKRSDLRVVGLAILVSETGHVPLLHRTYPGNGSDQAVLGSCLDGLGKLHDALDVAEQRTRSACRTLVRDGGCWSEQLELDLDVAGYVSFRQRCVTTVATLFLPEIRGEDSTHGGAADVQLAGDLGFADASEVKFSDLACLFPDRQRSTQMLSVEAGFGNTGADAFAEDLVLELSKHREQARHGPTGRRRQIQRFGKGHEADAQCGEFFQRDDQIDE